MRLTKNLRSALFYGVLEVYLCCCDYAWVIAIVFLWTPGFRNQPLHFFIGVSLLPYCTVQIFMGYNLFVDRKHNLAT